MSERVVTKRGKPYRSALAPYESEVKGLHAQGVSVRAIAAEMWSRHGLEISHNAVASFLWTLLVLFVLFPVAWPSIRTSCQVVPEGDSDGSVQQQGVEMK